MTEQGRFSLESGPAFTPFWRRLPRFFLYPLQLGPMLRMAGLSLAGGVAILLLGPFGALIYLITSVMFFKYAFVVMERTANGRFDEPNNLDGRDEGEGAQVTRQFGLFVTLGLICVVPLAVALGKVGLDIGLLLVSILSPAGIMIIATTHSVGQALNPGRMLFYVRTIGSPYLALCFLLVSVSSSGTWMKGFLHAHMHSWLALPLTNFVTFYFALITYHMMGYVIYQYHDKLGLHADVSFEQAEAKLSPNTPAADPFPTKLAALIADGREEEAISLLREELRTNWERNDLHERYQRLLVAAGKRDSALNHARDFIGKLVMEKRLFQALDLCEQGLKANPEFQLHNSDHVYELASAAHLAKRERLALDLMRSFDRRHPGHKHIPAVYLLSAQILSEHYRMNKEATQILRALQAKFPDHALAREARQYMEALARLEAAV